jgi:hypothetical protein
MWYTLPRRYFQEEWDYQQPSLQPLQCGFRVGSLALPQKMNLHSHMFRKALYSTSDKGPSTYVFGYTSYTQLLFILFFAWRSLCICMGTRILWHQGRLSYIHRPKWETLVHDQKEKHLTPFDQKWQAAIRRFTFLGVSAKDNSKHWAMRRLSQLLVLALSSSSILLYQFLQPTIGGKGQSLKVSCHSWGFDKATLKGILWDSASMNSRGSEVPTVLRK